MSTAPTVLMSFDPDSFVAGGLKDDFEGRIVAACAEDFNYGGSGPEVLAVKLTIEDLETKETFDQHYSFGPVDKWAANAADGGNTIVCIGENPAPNNNTNFAFFLSKLKQLGFPGDRMVKELSFMVGITGHWNRVAAPKRAGLEQPERPGKGAPTILVLTKKLKWPWEAGTAAARTAATATATTGRTRTRATAAPATAPAAAPAAPAPAPAPAPAAAPATASLDENDMNKLLEQIDTNAPQGTPVKLSIVKRAVFMSLNAMGLDAGACNIAIGTITPAFLIANGYMVEGDGNDTVITRL